MSALVVHILDYISLTNSDFTSWLLYWYFPGFMSCITLRGFTTYCTSRYSDFRTNSFTIKDLLLMMMLSMGGLITTLISFIYAVVVFVIDRRIRGILDIVIYRRKYDE